VTRTRTKLHRPHLVRLPSPARRLILLSVLVLLAGSVTPIANAAPQAGRAKDSVSLVDGRRIAGRLIAIEKSDSGLVALIGKGEGVERVPARLLIGATFAVKPARASPDPFNLYLAGGDRLRGKIEGRGEKLKLISKQISEFTVPLATVQAVCVGTFFGQVQANYRALFDRQREQTPLRDSVVVNRGSKPFSFRAVVLEVHSAKLAVRMGEQQRDLPRDKVYGFVRSSAEPAAVADGVLLARIYLVDGGRVTLPLDSIDAKNIVGGGSSVGRGCSVGRGQVTRIEFTGSHVAHLSAMNPISRDEVALFGKAPRWRRNEMVLGGPLQLNGVRYANGIGAQARSRIEFALGGRWDRFFVLAGIDDAASREGQAIFRVYGDGKLLKEITRRRGDRPAAMSLDVKGIDRIVLEALPGESYTSDLCDWAEARVYQKK
jgi:hypothetical protein